MTREREECISEAALRQHGIVTRRQLTEAGFTRSAVTRRLQSGRLRLLHRGVYLAIPMPLPHTRELAAVLANGEGALLSHLSAAALWGLRDAVEAPVDVTVVSQHRRRPGIRVYRVGRLGDDERTVRDGIPVTTAARTLLDVAGVLGTGELEATVARAERSVLVTGDALVGLLARHGGHAGAPALRAVLGRRGGAALTRSAAEARFLELVREAALPHPECNVSFGRYEIDFLWRVAGIAVEVDGYRYHSTRPRFEGDRRKDAELVAAGLTMLRLSWRQLTEEPLATMVRLGQALSRAGAGEPRLARDQAGAARPL